MDAKTIESLRIIFGADRVFTDAETLRKKSYDFCPLNLLGLRPRTASAVVQADRNLYERQLRELLSLALASEPKLAIIPRGGGSGVCGAANAKNGELVLDMTKLNKAEIVVHPTAEKDGLLLVQAGAMGKDIDDALGNERLTCGHCPASYYISTFGGWTGCDASGQYSAKFGKFADIVKNVYGFDGLDKTFSFSGENLKSVIGLEGAGVIITGGFLPIFKIPPRDGYLSFELDEAENVAEFLRVLSTMRAPLEEELATTLCAVRAYDYLDYHLIAKPHKGESDKAEWRQQIEYAAEKIICRGAKCANRFDSVGVLERRGKMPWTGFVYLTSASEEKLFGAIGMIGDEVLRRGGKLRSPEIARIWRKNRFKLGYDKLVARFGAGLMVDTFDCAPSWKTLAAAYENVRRALFNFGLAGAHIGLDLGGPYIYFTFAFPGRSENRYREAWEAALSACIKSGARTTHHHGIGALKSGKSGALTQHARGENWLRGAMKTKTALDPHDILNPNNFLKYET